MQDSASIRLAQAETKIGRPNLSTAADNPSYLLSLVLLGLSVFSVPRLSGQRTLILAGLAAVGFYLSLGRGRTRRHATRRGVALYTVILISVYLITFSRYDHTEFLLGITPMAFASVLAFLGTAVWLWRFAILRSLPVHAPALDLAVLAVALVSVIAYLSASTLRGQYGPPLEPRAHLIWVVIVSTLLYCIMNDLSRSAIAARVVRSAPLPLLISCSIATVWRWL
jgi:hypothetical protein